MGGCTRRDELRAAWAAFTPLLHAIDAGELAPQPYAAGTRGPPDADVLAAKAGFVKTGAYEWKEASAAPSQSAAPSVLV